MLPHYIVVVDLLFITLDLSLLLRTLTPLPQLVFVTFNSLHIILPKILRVTSTVCLTRRKSYQLHRRFGAGSNGLPCDFARRRAVGGQRQCCHEPAGVHWRV